MKIGIDVKALRTNKAGIGRYICNILDVLQTLDKTNEYVLFSPTPVPYEIFNKQWKFSINKGNLPGPGIIWQQITLPKLAQMEKVDIMWGPEQTLFFRKKENIKTVLTVHDLVFKRYPKTMQKTVLWIQRVFLKKSLNSADRIITNSEFTYRELLHFYPHLPKSKVISVPIGYFRHTSNDLKINRGDFLYCSGSMEPRKNLKNLIFALELLKKEGLEIKLVLTGPFGWKNRNFRNLLEKTPIRNQVENHAFVSQKELCHLYQTCRAFIFPSLYEGFGLPVLEAISFHTPVLTSRGTVMEEVAGPCALYFDAQSPQAIAKTIRSFWKDPAPLSLHKEQLVILEKYTWEKTAQTILKIFEDLYKGKTAC